MDQARSDLNTSLDDRTDEIDHQLDQS
jgi:hypothetical protein